MEWKEVRLGDVLQVKYGKDHKKLEEGNIPIYGSGGIMRYGDKYLYDLPSVLIPRKGTLSNIFFVEEPFWTVDTMFWTIIDSSKILPKYLYYAIKDYRWDSLNVGSAVPSLTVPVIEGVSINLHPLSTQRAIASILSAFDDKIAINRKICANLEAQAQALFKHWFIDFAPFKDGKFVESELGMIPEGWKVGTLGDYVENLSGYSYKGSELQPSSTAMATIKNFVRGGGFKTEGFKEIVISKNIKDYQYVNLFDVLVAHTDLTQNAEVVGNPAIILSTAGYEKLIMSMDLTKVIAKDSRLTAPLLHSILSTKNFKEQALGYVNGTTVLHMSKKAVPEYKLAMPNNLDILKDLTTILHDLYHMMSETFAENMHLSSLRDTLLPKLMSGEIKI